MAVQRGSSRTFNSVEFTTALDLETGRRVPPQDLLAEKAVLGSLMLNNGSFSEVLDLLLPEDFYSPANEQIYDAMFQLLSDGSPIDQITVIDKLTKTGKLEQIGGADTVIDIVEQAGTSANIEYYAEIVKNMSILRRLIQTGARIEQLGYTTEGSDVNEALNIAQESVYKLGMNSGQQEYTTATNVLTNTLKKIEELRKTSGKLTGVPTGLIDIDNVLHGLKPGQMVVIAARPGVGKSTLANNIAITAAIHNKIPTIMFNLEMAQEEIMMRILSAELSIEHGSLTKGTVKPEEMQRIEQFANTLRGTDNSPIPLYIDDSPNISMPSIRTKSRQILSEFEGKTSNDRKGLIIIDYLNLMSSGERSESRQQEVADISRKLKLLAKELQVPVIAITQISREAEKQSSSGRPKMSHLRESGAIEQDADIVILIHQEYVKQNEGEEGGKRVRKPEAEIIIEKNRSGQTGVYQVVGQLNYCRFNNFSRDVSEQGSENNAPQF